MYRRLGKLIELPEKGKTLIITDIHGNYADFEKFMFIWDDFGNGDNHLVLTGDFIHAMGLENDRSIEILESVKNRWENSQNFHVLLGNHEWSAISKMSVYKAGINQTLNFEELLKKEFHSQCEHKLEEYKKFFKKLPIAVRTANKVFISHAGPPRNIKSIDEIINIADDGYVENPKLFQILWNRQDDLNESELDSFLRAVDCKAMIVGHTPVDGAKIMFTNQLVVSSSYGLGKKAYVELDLEKEIKKGKDLFKMVKYLR